MTKDGREQERDHKAEYVPAGSATALPEPEEPKPMPSEGRDRPPENRERARGDSPWLGGG